MEFSGEAIYEYQQMIAHLNKANENAARLAKILGLVQDPAPERGTAEIERDQRRRELNEQTLSERIRFINKKNAKRCV